jgi:outer membrane protein OmpA-like peptidoglycan-associated protein
MANHNFRHALVIKLAAPVTRVDVVMQYMISQGVKPELVSARGFSQAGPIASYAMARGRGESRRVEISLAGAGT